MKELSIKRPTLSTVNQLNSDSVMTSDSLTSLTMLIGHMETSGRGHHTCHLLYFSTSHTVIYRGDYRWQEDFTWKHPELYMPLLLFSLPHIKCLSVCLSVQVQSIWSLSSVVMVTCWATCRETNTPSYRATHTPSGQCRQAHTQWPSSVWARTLHSVSRTNHQLPFIPKRQAWLCTNYYSMLPDVDR